MGLLGSRPLTKTEKRARRRTYAQEFFKLIDTGLQEGGKFGDTAINALGTNAQRKRR